MPDAFHDRFAAALRDGRGDPLAEMLSDPAQGARFAVYRNNVVRGAIEALRAAYPAVNRLVGEEFFSPMAHAFWETRPATTRTMTLYGEGFDAHVARYAPARELVYLADIARHDRAWLEAHHAADEAALKPADAAQIPPDRLASLAPGLHVSVRLLVSDWPAYPIWRGNRFDETPPRIALERRRSASLVWRSAGEVRHRALPSGEYAFLAAIGSGEPIEQAASALMQEDAGGDPFALFGAALRDGLLGPQN